jgi:hypothetical protein
MNDFKENLKLFLSKAKNLDTGLYAKISDPKQLYKIWKKACPGSKREKRIEDILVEIYSKISNAKQLIKLWRDVSAEDKLREIIEDRLVEVCFEIFDPEKLNELWGETSAKTKPEKIINNRTIEVIRAIPPDNAPKWFKEIILGKRKILKFAQNEIEEKAQEIYEKI